MMRRKAFTLIELLVVISIIALLISILLPALGAARQAARKQQNTVNLRSLHQGAFIHAQDNKTWYPGLNNKGEAKTPGDIKGSYGGGVVFQAAPGHNGTYTVPRYIEMMANDILTHNDIYSPAENGEVKKVWEAGGSDPNLRHINISYAVLDLGGDISASGRKLDNSAAQSWRDDVNSQTPVFCDRNASTSDGESFSIWDEDRWEGGVVFNDGHAEYLTDTVVEATKLNTTTVMDDELFDFAETGTDAEARGEHVRMIKRNANETIGGES